MATIYKEVAKAALMKRHNVIEEEAQYKIEHETNQELEPQVHSKGSVTYGVLGIAKECGLSKEETMQLLEASINGPEDADILVKISPKVNNFSNENILSILAAIHDGWLKDNSSEQRFQKKCETSKLRHYAPLELIGWNEVTTDLLFLIPILESFGVEVDENSLENSYHEKVKKYLHDNKIGSKKDLIKLLRKGKSYYDVLPDELAGLLDSQIDEVAKEIIENWQEKDTKSYEIMKDVDKQNRSI